MKHSGEFKNADEAGRLAALRRYEILDSTPERDFQDIVSLVRSIFDVEYTEINFIDAKRQWTKAAAGSVASQRSRNDTLCNHTIHNEGPLSVQDIQVDPRFQNSTVIQTAAHVRSYLGVPITTPDGYNIGALCIFDSRPREFSQSDIQILDNFSKLLMSHLELRVTARLDSLTGALTRRAFHERLEQIRTQGAHVSIAMLDLDYFKMINDTFGHTSGDIVLKAVVKAIFENIRPQDLVGRFGGEEFVICMPGISKERAYNVVEMIRKAISKLKIPELKGHHLTISSGVTCASQYEELQVLLERADCALYLSKNNGRNKTTLI